MVKTTSHNGKEYYQCEACGFYYENKELAGKCEHWCEEKHSCNIDITKHAVSVE